MARSPLLYLIAYVPLLIISLAFTYLGYQWKLKRYRRIFLKTLKREGVPRKIAKSLAKEIRVLRLKDFLKYENMRSIL